jgi:hypothetical protein
MKPPKEGRKSWPGNKIAKALAKSEKSKRVKWSHAKKELAEWK